MGEQHLDLLPTATGLHVLRSCGVRTGHVASIFVQVPRDLAGKSVRAALGFEFADVAIQFAGAIKFVPLGCDAASGNGVCASELDQLFARRAGVTVAFGVEGKIGAGERAVGSVGLVEDRNVRRDLLAFVQPSQALRRTVGAVGGQECGLYAEARLGSLQHCPRRSDFRLSDGARGFDIDDHTMVGVDQVVIGIGEEGVSLCAPVHWAAGSVREMNFGVTGDAAPNAASSRVARYSCAARVAVSLISSGFHSRLETDRCLLASAAIKLASTANPSALSLSIPWQSRGL